MKEDYAKYILNKTRDDYNLILDKFSSTRKFIWRDLYPLFNYMGSSDKVLDLGCGNGRLFEIFKNKNAEYIGIDNVSGLIDEAQKRFPEGSFQVFDALNLPFSDNYFDKVYCIAVLHHIPSIEFRLKVLEEVRRVLKPKGNLILTVWNLRNIKRAKKLLLKYTLLKIIGKSKLDFKDIFLPWRDNKGKVVTDRYIHSFSKSELKKITKKTGLKVKEIGYLEKKYNIYLIAEK